MGISKVQCMVNLCFMFYTLSYECAIEGDRFGVFPLLHRAKSNSSWLSVSGPLCWAYRESNGVLRVSEHNQEPAIGEHR